MVTNKKGMYFTILTISFLVIFLFFFTTHTYRKLTDKMFVIESRVTSMDSFLHDVERDLERGLYISSFRAILSLQDYMTTKGEFFSNFSNSFKEAVVNGTINGTPVSLMFDSTTDSRIVGWIDNIKRQAHKLNLNLNISILNFTLYQSDPWRIKIGINVSIILNDSTQIAEWRKQSYIETFIHIEGLEDPLYIVNGLGRYSNLINRTPYENNFTHFNGSEWNVSNLIEHFENSLYLDNPSAPSFLMRFENNLDPSPNGIESIVNLQELSNRFTPEELTIYYDKSVVDYIYWSSQNPDIYRINFTPSWYKIDNEHRATYNVTSISYPYEE